MTTLPSHCNFKKAMVAVHTHPHPVPLSLMCDAVDALIAMDPTHPPTWWERMIYVPILVEFVLALCRRADHADGAHERQVARHLVARLSAAGWLQGMNQCVQPVDAPHHVDASDLARPPLVGQMTSRDVFTDDMHHIEDKAAQVGLRRRRGHILQE
jgi:hypothetical protein